MTFYFLFQGLSAKTPESFSMVTMVTTEQNAQETSSGTEQHFQNADVSEYCSVDWNALSLCFQNNTLYKFIFCNVIMCLHPWWMFHKCKTTHLVLHYTMQRSLNNKLQFVLYSFKSQTEKECSIIMFLDILCLGELYIDRISRMVLQIPIASNPKDQF